jgi:hypothetical protein
VASRCNILVLAVLAPLACHDETEEIQLPLHSCVTCRGVVEESQLPNWVCRGAAEEALNKLVECACVTCRFPCLDNACQLQAPLESCLNCVDAVCPGAIEECLAN